MAIYIDNKKEIDVTVIGRVTIDFNPTDYYNTLDRNKNFNMYLGGSAGNIVVGLARYERKVNFISRISNDQFGVFIKNFYLNEKITVDQIQQDPDLKTGLTFTEMLSDTHSTILMYREEVADLNIQLNEIDFEKIKNSKLTLLSGVSLSKEPSRKSCLKVFETAYNNNSLTIFDLDYRPYTWKSRAEINEIYWKATKISKILVGSEEEFEFLLLQDNKHTSDLEQLFKILFNQFGVEIIILKKGSRGSTLYTSTKKISIGVANVKLLKGFGGGDAYISSFINSLLSNSNDLEGALVNATCAAAMVVSSLSSSEAMPYLSSLKSFKKIVSLSKEVEIEEW